MLYLGYVLLRDFLIYNLEVSVRFYLTFLQLKVIKMFTQCTVKTVLFLTSGYFLRAPENSNFFRIPLKVRVIGSRLCIINTVVFDFLTYGTHVFFQDVEQASLYIIIKICPKQGQGFKPSAAHLYPNIGRGPPPPPPGALDHEPFYICEYTSAEWREKKQEVSVKRQSRLSTH